MTRIDVDAILAAKAPALAGWLRRPIAGWLKRVIHQEEMNEMLRTTSHLPPQEFIRACFRTWEIAHTIEGLEKIDPRGRYLFAANHPFGGMDGMMLADHLVSHFGDARVVVNDLLMHMTPLQPLWIPVNKHGRQSMEYARRFDEEFASELPILTFPAGLCSRRTRGVVSDLKWRTNFVKMAERYNREVVPVFVEGHLSNFFYRLSNFRKWLGVKFNIEMLYLPDEMFSQHGNHFRLRVGEPISLDELARQGDREAQAQYVRERVYALGRELR